MSIHRRGFTFRQRDQVYLKHFQMLMVTAMLLVTVTASLLFYSFERIARSIMFSEAINLLDQTASEASSLVNTGRQLTLQIYEDQSIQPLLHHKVVSAQEMVIAMQQLQNYQHIMKFVDSIYVYNYDNQLFYSSVAPVEHNHRVIPVSEFYDQSLVDIIVNYPQYQAYSPIPHTILEEDGNKKAFYCFLGYYFMDKTQDKALRCAVIVNISADWVKNVTELNIQSMQGETVIVDRSGSVISNSEHFSMESSLAGEDWLETLTQSDQNGYLITEVNGVKTFVAYTIPDALGWRYLRFIPYKSIIQPIDQVRLYTLIIAIAIGLGSVLAVWFLNRIIYRPIEDIRDNLGILEDKQRRTFYRLKQDYLRRLILESNDIDPSSVESEFQAYRIELPSDGVYYLAVICLDHYKDFLHSNSDKERASYVFAILNIACEIFSDIFYTEGVNVGGNTSVILLRQHSETQDIAEAEWTNRFEQVRDAVKKHLGHSISVAISAPGLGVGQLNALFNQANETIRYRLFAGRGCILFAGRIDRSRDDAYVYPERKEKLLQDALTKSKLDRAKEIYFEIVKDCRHCTYNTINGTLIRLMFFMNTVMKNVSSSNDFFFVDFSQLETVDEINQVFFHAMETIVQHNAEKACSKMERLVQSIDAIIAEQFSNPSLGIESIADMLKLSTGYTGRIYKQYTMHTILERILEVRMEKARWLLLNTDEPISAISQLTGFTRDTYFYKIFRTENGMTPSAYRQKQGRSDSTISLE